MRRYNTPNLLLLIAAFALLFACGDDTPSENAEENDNDGLNIVESPNDDEDDENSSTNGADPPNSNQNAGNSNTNGVEPTIPQVDFVIKNDSEESVFVQAATEPGPGWLAVMFEDDDEELHIRWDCSLPCECPTNDDDVVACQECGMMPPHPQELKPGEKVRTGWSGLYRKVVDDCFEEIQLYDDVMRAELCYGSHPSGDEPVEFAEGYVEDLQCETIDFQLGVDDEVMVTVE